MEAFDKNPVEIKTSVSPERLENLRVRAGKLGLKLEPMPIAFKDAGTLSFFDPKKRTIAIPEKIPPVGTFTHELRHAIDTKLGIEKKLEPKLTLTEWAGFSIDLKSRLDLGARK